MLFDIFLISLLLSACATAKTNWPQMKKDYFPAGDHGQAYYHYLLAQMHQQSGNLDPAIDQLRRATQLDPSSAQLQTQLAGLYLKKGAAPQALQAAERAIQLDPQYVPAHLLVGGALSFFQPTRKSHPFISNGGQK